MSESRSLYGVKAQVSEQRRWLPNSSVIVQGFTPASGAETDTQVMAGYVFGWELPNRWQLDAALRYGTESGEGDHFNVWAPSVVLKAPLGERWNVHAEYFGLCSQNRAQDAVRHFFSPGVHYWFIR